jgi:hypothetical protein
MRAHTHPSVCFKQSQPTSRTTHFATAVGHIIRACWVVMPCNYVGDQHSVGP